MTIQETPQLSAGSDEDLLGAPAEGGEEFGSLESLEKHSAEALKDEEAGEPVQADAPKADKALEGEKAPKAQDAPPVVEAAPSDQAYTPLAKIKVKDTDVDVPDFVKKALTKDNEPEFKRLLEQAYGLPEVAASRDSYKAQLEEFTTQVYPHYQELLTNVNEVIAARESGDVRTVLDKIGVPLEKVAELIIEEAELRKMPASVQQTFQQRRALEERTKGDQRQIDALNAQVQQSRHQLGQIQLDAALVDPSVKAIADRFDQVLGAQSFKQKVIQYGIVNEKQGKAPSVAEAVQQTLAEVSKYLALIPSQPAAAQPSPGVVPQQQPNPGLPAAPKKPTLPTIGGGGMNASTVAREIGSLEDIERVAEEHGV